MTSVYNLAVFVSGRGSNFRAVLKGIADGRIPARVPLVIADHVCPALDAAPEATLVSNDPSEIAAALQAHDIEYIALLGYLKILPKEIVGRYANRIVNIHPSLIPAFCGKGMYGSHVHEAVLARGCKVTGVTTHFVDEGADTGPIIMQRPVPVEAGDTVETLASRVLEVEHATIVETLETILGGER
ncbi:phosphoribosylglycinamide formyltransferase [Peptoniphilus equinus]|uniref:Phosphoribosylglycinamide formyltransferase n=1 Tax=Peptoniphilus equinus TaxID=3016343 RepID=A0ABY7QTB2_9FIRM|nr:phosphoribosylglycinamide formyltransferase [Peptoniphilus equinus]WBW50032.1 phosphoribosylglycinamide formyltransferase [Peptoniphilus equinus]